MTDLYRVLQVHHEAEPEVVEAAYRRLARRYHPDVNPSPDAASRMRDLNGAYEVLGDPERRAAYDRSRRPMGEAATWNRARPDSPPNPGADRARAASASPPEPDPDEPRLVLTSRSLDAGPVSIGSIAPRSNSRSTTAAVAHYVAESPAAFPGSN